MPTATESSKTVRFDGRLQPNANALFLHWLKVGKGFYLNYFSTKGSLIHRWSCEHLYTNKGIWDGTVSATSYAKICARTMHELKGWAEASAVATRACYTCRPDEHLHDAPSLDVYELALYEITERALPFSQKNVPATASPSPASSPVLPERLNVMRLEYARDPSLARQVKKLYHGACQVCGHRILLPGNLPYAEAHHIRPLKDRGSDDLGNLLCVCPNCHVELDYRAKPIHLSALRILADHHLLDANVDYHNGEVNKLSGDRLSQRSDESTLV